MRLELTTISSAAAQAVHTPQVALSHTVLARAGSALALRVLEDKDRYNELEDPHGQMHRLRAGDRIAGVLGRRRALHGHAGEVPLELACGEEIHVLNLGGVVGRCTSSHDSVGSPLRVEILGQILAADGQPAVLDTARLPSPQTLPTGGPPLVLIAGGCMNSGKTEAACAVVEGLADRGLTVAAAKLTGVALRRDTLAMLEAGAASALSFLDAGLPSTDAQTAPPAARAIIAALGAQKPDVIVAELGDGLLGDYGVMAILQQEDLMAAQPTTIVCCASDPVGAWGAARILEAAIGHGPHLFTGPVTDNEVGRASIAAQLQRPAFNAVHQRQQLASAVFDHVIASTQKGAA